MVQGWGRIYTFGLWCVLLATADALAVTADGLAIGKGGNRLLAVGVPDQLEGIDLDLKNITAMATHPSFRFQANQLWREEGTVKGITDKTSELAAQVPKGGTFFFYFSGHGNSGSLEAYDRSLKIAELRTALVKGRAEKGPLDRLVLMFDSCYSGSLLDPLKHAVTDIFQRSQSAVMADAVVEALAPGVGDAGAPLWNSLFVFASSLEDELSNDGEEGSAFTVALRRAFDETLDQKGTLAELVKRTKAYTEEHHPIERFFPATLAGEGLVAGD